MKLDRSIGRSTTKASPFCGIVVGSCLLLCALLAASWPLLASGANPSVDLSLVPGHLRITQVDIVEGPPFILFNPDPRTVTFSITVAEPPSCAAGVSGVKQASYGFLIDHEPDSGRKISPFSEMGIDSLITVSCNPKTGALESSLGALTVVGSTISIATTVVELPGNDFQYIAYAMEGDTVVRSPAAPQVARWATTEILFF
jgi:hypothetical protein